MTARYSHHFQGRTAIITGAGGGLGRCYALALAEMGARVVINDLGTSRDGAEEGASTADETADLIRCAGGAAIADRSDVRDQAQVDEMVARAHDKFGSVDILVNNAGILGPGRFGTIDTADSARLIDVHLGGTINCCKAVWEIMRAQRYGRILMTSSPAGLYGLFGNASYCAAKAGVIGLMHALRIEGAARGIRANAIVPIGATRMTMDSGAGEEVLRRAKPEAVVPAAAYLVSEEAPTGVVLCSGMGVVEQHSMQRGSSIYLSESENTFETLMGRINSVVDLDEKSLPRDGLDMIASVSDRAR